MRPRDSQRKKVYSAESTVRHLSRTFIDFDETCQYVRKICHSKWLRTNYCQDWEPTDTITVGDGRGRRKASGSFFTKTIKLPKWARHEIVVLHEIAHVLVSSYQVAPHGPEFVGCLLRLVKHFMGDRVFVALNSSFKEHKVRTKTKSKRILTEQQKEVLRDRIAQARAVKAAAKICEQPLTNCVAVIQS